MKKIHGITPAVLTPFDKDLNVDYAALKEHVDFLIDKGVHCLYPVGTAGEGVSLTVEERKAVAEKVIEYADGRVDVFIHVGAMNVNDSCTLARHALAAGAAGVGAVTPFFYNVTQEDLMDYYRTLTASVPEDFPVYIYNLPSCAVNDIKADSVAELAKIPNLAGIKNTQPEITRMIELLAKVPEDFVVINGDDSIVMPSLAVGAHGAVSGTSNMIPEVFVKLYNAVQAGDLVTARAQQEIIRKVFVAMKGFYITSVKAALEMRGFRRMYTRPPQKYVMDRNAYAAFEAGLRQIFDDDFFA